jgi:hypothetical protein
VAFFLFMFFGIYGGMHAYFLVKVVRALRPAWYVRVPLAVFLVVMLFAPILLRMMERSGLEDTARVVAPWAYGWMAVLFWFDFLFLCTDLWNVGMFLAARLVPAARGLLCPPRAGFVVISGFVLVATVWSVIEAAHIRVDRTTVRTPLLEPGSRPIRMVQISDLHLGLIVGEDRLRDVVRLVEAERPDILVSTGDLMDASADHVEHLAPLLAAVEAPLGKFAVTGNHEYYAGLRDAIAFHEACGFRVLRAESVLVDGRLRIAGVDDRTGRWREGVARTDEDAALPPTEGREATVLLKHRPIVREASLGRFDLQLSGHIHGGQVFPFGVVVWWVNGLGTGRHDLADGSVLYVNRGTGTWGPPMRLFTPPEVTVVTIVPASEAGERAPGDGTTGDGADGGE